MANERKLKCFEKGKSFLEEKGAFFIIFKGYDFGEKKRKSRLES